MVMPVNASHIQEQINLKDSNVTVVIIPWDLIVQNVCQDLTIDHGAKQRAMMQTNVLVSAV